MVNNVLSTDDLLLVHIQVYVKVRVQAVSIVRGVSKNRESKCLYGVYMMRTEARIAMRGIANESQACAVWLWAASLDAVDSLTRL
jgi:hypothetical protein